MATYYFKDTKSEYSGCSSITTSLSIDNIDSAIVDYTEMTFAEYKKSNPNKEYTTPMLWEDYYENIEKPYLKNLCGEWKETTEERYWDMLECLPPMKWHDIQSGINMFFVSECYSGDLYTCCLRLTNNGTKKYYSALRSKYITDSEVLTELKNQNII